MSRVANTPTHRASLANNASLNKIIPSGSNGDVLRETELADF